MGDKETSQTQSAHVLVLPYPTTGHINPMLQFAKRLAGTGLKVTMAITNFVLKSSMEIQTGPIAVETISDGFDEGGFKQAPNFDVYHQGLEAVGSKTLTEIILKYQSSLSPFTWLIYDAVLTWPLDVAKGLGLSGAAFFTQSCAVDAIYFTVRQGELALPLQAESISWPALPPLTQSDLPSFISCDHYPVFRELLLGQFRNLEKADWLLCNTFYELESEVASWMLKSFSLKTIGPTLPSLYLDMRVEGDDDYGLSPWNKNGALCKQWLDVKPGGSVVYVSFGSGVGLRVEQMEELAWGLLNSAKYFLWVVRASEEEKLPQNFKEAARERKGLIVQWCPQLEVLAHPATGCFVTHCGWNSTLEGLSMGVPLVAVPQWSDQPTNAKYVEDVWGSGLRATVDDNGIVTREEIGRCIKEALEGERAENIKTNAQKWSRLAKEAVDKGGSSDKNIEEFVARVTRYE